MESFKVLQVSLLQGNSNWKTWKYKMLIYLKGISGTLDVVEGRLVKPQPLDENSDQTMKDKYDEDLKTYLKADSTALLALSTNMTEETLEKVMRYSTACDVWRELYRLFEGVSEDKAYNLCLEFFSYKKSSSDDISSHLSKLKNIWRNLQEEISRDPNEKCNLPEMLLICKILGTLPEEYFSFKSSWLLMSKTERNIENLTHQLCAYERVLSSKNNEAPSEEVLMFRNKDIKSGINVKGINYKRQKFLCHYCKKPGHFIKQCRKWKADGEPSKPSFKERETSAVEAEEESILPVEEVSSLSYEDSKNLWFVDNGAVQDFNYN